MENEYEFKRVDDTSALLNFKCGIEPIDKFIEDKKNGLDKFIKLHLSNLWIVFEDNEAVALFALSKDAIVLNSEDRHNIENDNQDVSSFVSPDDEEKFWEKERFPAIEIDYLAVRKDKRNANLGTLIINAISERAATDELSATIFLTVEAYDTKEYSAIDFYKKCNFEFSDVAQNKYNYAQIYNGEIPITRRMYKIIIPNQ